MMRFGRSFPFVESIFSGKGFGGNEYDMVECNIDLEINDTAQLSA
jgi:hypothetical protein